jgi:hypothetical protein
MVKTFDRRETICQSVCGGLRRERAKARKSLEAEEK